MEKTNFENLQIYQLAERLADEIWHSAVQWPNLARDTVGNKRLGPLTALGPTSPKVAAEAARLIIAGFCGWRVVRYMKPAIGCAALIAVNSWRKPKFQP